MNKPLLATLVALALTSAPAAGWAQGHAAHGKAAPPKPATARVDEHGVRVIELTVTARGFEPANVQVKAGSPVRLVITRKTDKTCATELVMPDLGIEQPLPLDTPVTVEFTPDHKGTLRYACGMDHVKGILTVG